MERIKAEKVTFMLNFKAKLPGKRPHQTNVIKKDDVFSSVIDMPTNRLSERFFPITVTRTSCVVGPQVKGVECWGSFYNMFVSHYDFKIRSCSRLKEHCEIGETFLLVGNIYCVNNHLN